MKSDQQLRQEISNARKLLRERRKQRWGTASKPTSYRKGEHDYVYGVLAHTQRRLEIFRAAGGEADWFDRKDPSSVMEIKPASCQLCAETHLVGWEEGEWDHQCKLRKKCDAVKCSAFGCKKGHTLRHGRYPRWAEK